MLERLLKNLLLLLVLLHVFGLGFWIVHLRDDFYRIREIPQEKRTLIIPDGASFNDVLVELRRRGWSPEPVLVRLFITLNQESIVVKKGEYQLPEKASTWDLLKIFDNGRVALVKLTIPEGLDQWETATLLAENGWGTAEEFLSLIRDPSPIKEIDPLAPHLEGYLFPETYLFPKETQPLEIIKAMTNLFQERTTGLRLRLAERGLTIREWVTLASLVEKETSIPEERARIAGVFENRLNRGMLLQCDPTIVYSLKLENRYRGRIYKSEITFNHPYNTYVTKGLPPGPITSPGLAALEAALAPEDTPFLYFVAQADGSHFFSQSLSEHNRAVQRYRQGR